MERISKEDLKKWFEAGDRPTEEDFSKLIDECYNGDDTVTIDELIEYVASCGFVTLEEFGNLHHEITEEEANRLMDEVDSMQWTLNINTATYEVTMDGDVGSWMDYRSKLGRYAMTNDGNARKLNRDNSRLLEVGTEYDTSSCHIMTRFPKLYYSVTTSGDVVSITLSEREFNDCKSFDEQWIGSYLGAVVDNALVSRADLNPTRSKTINKFWDASQVNGSDWGLSDYRQHQMMLIIYLCEFLAMNSQLNLGNGMTGDGDNWCDVVQNAKAGSTSVLGDKCGKVDFTESGQTANDACHVSLFGIEDPYGWFYEFVQGVYFGIYTNEGQDGTECFIYEGNRMPTNEELAGTPSGIYRKITRLKSWGWIKKLIWGANLDVLPETLGGGKVNGHGDYGYANTTGRTLTWGGYAKNGAACGIASSFTTSFGAWSFSGSHYAARLAYYGKAKIMDENSWTLKINTATYDVTMGGNVNSWLNYRSKLGRYAMTNDGKARKLNRYDSRLFEDGSEYDASSVHIMTRFPKLYYSVNTNGDVVSIKLSEREFIGCNSFEEQWIGSYLGAIVDGALVSRSGITPKKMRTINGFWEGAQVNGSDWGLSNYQQRQMMMVVYLCEYLDVNSQLNLGLGMTGNGNNWTYSDGSPVEVVINAKTGATSVLGDKCGKVAFTESGQTANDACHVSLFGVEDPYGWFDEFIQGVYFGSSSNENQDGTECFIYDGNRLPTTEELKVTPTGIYRKITRLTSSGFVKKLMFGTNLDIFPDTLFSGTVDSHSYNDYYLTRTTGQVLMCGGYAGLGASCGLGYSCSYTWQVTGYSIVARLSYYGKVNIV